MCWVGFDRKEEKTRKIGTGNIHFVVCRLITRSKTPSPPVENVKCKRDQKRRIRVGDKLSQCLYVGGLSKADVPLRVVEIGHVNFKLVVD